MTRLLMIRHGQSFANIEGIFAGHTDSPLSDMGIQQAELTAQYILKHYQVDAVYSSDLQRAVQTGEAVALRFGLPLVKCRELREIFGGAWEQMPYASLPELYPETYGVWLTDIGNAVCDDGESVAMLKERVVDKVKEICVDNAEKTVVIATHATPIRAVQCYCEGRSLAQMKDVPWVSNASVSEFIFDNNSLEIVRLAYDKHLGDITSVLPKTC